MAGAGASRPASIARRRATRPRARTRRVPRCRLQRANCRGADGAKGRRRHWRTLVDVGPVVAEAMAVNAVLRAFSGYILFLLAFLLRSVDLGTVFHPPGDARLRAGRARARPVGRQPHLDGARLLLPQPGAAADHVHRAGHRAVGNRGVRLGLLACGRPSASSSPPSSAPAWPTFFHFSREIGDGIRSSTFSVSETLNQVANIASSLAGGGRVDPGQRAGRPGDRRRRASPSLWSCCVSAASDCGSGVRVASGSASSRRLRPSAPRLS